MFERILRSWRVRRRMRRRTVAMIATGSLEWDDTILVRRRGDGRRICRIRWTDVREIVSYKSDLLTIDQIILAFRVEGPTPEHVYCLDEDRGATELFFEELPPVPGPARALVDRRRVPGLRDELHDGLG